MNRTVTPGSECVKAVKLADGTRFYEFSDGSWVVDLPGEGRHVLTTVDTAAAQKSRMLAVADEAAARTLAALR